jgi:hypothetical protein
MADFSIQWDSSGADLVTYIGDGKTRPLFFGGTPEITILDSTGNPSQNPSDYISQLVLQISNPESTMSIVFNNNFSGSNPGISLSFNTSTGLITLTASTQLDPAQWDSAIGQLQYTNSATTATEPVGTTHTISLVSVTSFGGAYTTTTQIGNDSIVVCFYPGTRIRTPDGEVAVETLKAGDLVLTADGAAAPVRWIGRQTVSTVFGDKLRVLPIRIRAGALADSVPARDLLVSPDHGLLVEGVMVQAAALVNETSIVRESAVPQTFTYRHIELDGHALVIAEGAPAETFVDNIDRQRFDNWCEYEALYPDGKSVEELPYPRAKSRRQLPAGILALIEERARAIGAAVAAVA